MISEFLKRLMFARQFNIDNGKVDILGCDHVMLASEFFYSVEELDKMKVYEIAKGSTEKLVDRYFQKIGSDQTRSNDTVEGIFNNFGLGRLQVLEARSDRIVVQIPNSTIAEHYRKTRGFAHSCQCSVTAGVLAGFFSYLRKKDMNAQEMNCIAMGNEACKFVIE